MNGNVELSERFITVDQAAELTGLSHWTVRNWLQKGLLTRYKVASRTVVNRAELLERVKPHRAVPESDNLNYAVLGRGDDFLLIDCANESESPSGAVATGYEYCGYIAVQDGVPKVRCEPTFAAALIVARAGVAFAGILGEHLKRRQLGLAVERQQSK